MVVRSWGLHDLHVKPTHYAGLPVPLQIQDAVNGRNEAITWDTVAAAFVRHAVQWSNPASVSRSSRLCCLDGSTLVLGRGAQAIQVEMCMANLAWAHVAGSESALIAVVPYPHDDSGVLEEVATVKANPNNTHAWILVVASSALAESLDALKRAGCLRHDLGNMYRGVDILGTGTFSTVLRAYGNDSSAVAIKRQPETCAVAIRSEVSCLVQAGAHPNVIGLRALFPLPGTDDVRDIAIVLDYAAGGDLFNYCVQRGTCTEELAAYMLRGLLLALAHVHSHNVIHRDVKPENLLVAGDGRPVLADFGIAARLAKGQKLSERVGSLGYAAPEVIMGHKYSFEIDTFGAGGVLHFMIAGTPPYTGKDKNKVMWKTCQGHLNLKRSPWNQTSGGCKEILQHLLAPQCKDRPSAHAAMRHSWLNIERDATLLGKGGELLKVCSLWRWIDAVFGPKA